MKSVHCRNSPCAGKASQSSEKDFKKANSRILNPSPNKASTVKATEKKKASQEKRKTADLRRQRERERECVGERERE